MVTEYPLSDILSTNSSGSSPPCQSIGSCAGHSENPCLSGCWFLFTHAGCKQGSECKHCHRHACCVIADQQRRELRRQHSRLRPSKKKRDRLSRLKAMENNGMSCLHPIARDGERWETSHIQTPSVSGSTEAPQTPPAEEEETRPHLSLEDLEHLLNLIQGTL